MITAEGKKMSTILLFLLLFHSFSLSSSSSGDRSEAYQVCSYYCNEHNCSPSTAPMFYKIQPYSLKLLGWSCSEECKYTCMWKTVNTFVQNGYNIPQFFGKWPFIRVLGIQEPASAVFSVLNGLSNLIMLIRFRRQVPKDAPFYYLWHGYALVTMNAWFWSTVFHTRDFDWTEKLDYFCAISLVLYSMYAACIRFVGTQPLWKPVLLASGHFAFLIYHISYLTLVRFDYGYNMAANVTVGTFQSIGWFTFFWKNRSKPFVKYGFFSVIAVNFLLLLELLDFPPLWWTFDAHSLWHLGTIPVPFLWYRFVIADTLWLAERETVKAKRV